MVSLIRQERRDSQPAHSDHTRNDGAPVAGNRTQSEAKQESYTGVKGEMTWVNKS